MSGEQFTPSGAIVVVVGTVTVPDGAVRPSINVQMQGELEKMNQTREGLQQAQALLLEAVAAVGRAMLAAPGQADGLKIMQARAMPPMPKGFRM